jgi:FMN-dependent NADH-azoreductase
MKLLHIIATPRDQASNTLRISSVFLDELSSRNEDLQLETLDLFNRDLPSVAGDNIEAKYHLMAGLSIDKEQKESWRQIEHLIEHFLAADLYLITAPMWNFGIPYTLKYYIDAIVQPGYLFRYNEYGQAEGLVTNKKMFCITSRGGDYSPGSPFHAYDFQEPYLRAIFGFVGITDISFINANTMDVTPDLREESIERAIADVKQIAANTEWHAENLASPREHPQGLKPPVID